MAYDDKIAEHRARQSALRSELQRSGHRGTWKQLSDYMLPHKERFFENMRTNDGKRRMDHIYDGTAMYSLRVGRSGMMSGVTNPARPWFRLGAPDPAMAKFPGVNRWLYDVQQRMEWIFARSNLYKILPSVYESLLCFGTAVVIVLRDPQRIVRFVEFPLGSYLLASNAKGVVDTCYRDLQMTVKQLVEMFGEENVSVRVKNLWQAKGAMMFEWINVVHAIQPNGSMKYGSKLGANKKISSCWYEADSNEQKFLRESGFDSFPLLAPRWETNDTDVYGHSPAVEVLGDVKQLQYQSKLKSEGIEKQVKPPTQGPPSIDAVDTLPGGHTTVPLGSADGVRQIYEGNGINLRDLKEDMAETRQRIQRGLFEDVFLMISQIDRAQITAYEIAERKEEKLLMLGPVLENLEDDLLDPLIDRTFEAMVDARMIPIPPRELQGMQLRVEYISIMHQAMRAVGASAMDRFLNVVVQSANAWPEALDKVNIDETIDHYGENYGVPPSMIRSDDETAKVRAERQRQQQMQTMVENADKLANAGKAMSETPLRGGEQGETAMQRALDVAGLQ